jgi:hypothetical protein
VTPRRRHAIVGLGSRSRLYTTALLGKYQQSGELVGLCDVLLLEDLFGEHAGEHPLRRGAGYLDGCTRSCPAFGANRAFATGQPVDLTGLVKL